MIHASLQSVGSKNKMKYLKEGSDVWHVKKKGILVFTVKNCKHHYINLVTIMVVTIVVLNCFIYSLKLNEWMNE